MIDYDFGTVTAINDGSPSVKLDGSDDAVNMLTASSYSPTVGDRVKVARVGGRYIAEYAVKGFEAVDLSNYYTMSEVDALISGIDLSNYYTKSNIDSRLNGYLRPVAIFQNAADVATSNSNDVITLERANNVYGTSIASASGGGILIAEGYRYYLIVSSQALGKFVSLRVVTNGSTSLVIAGSGLNTDPADHHHMLTGIAFGNTEYGAATLTLRPQYGDATTYLANRTRVMVFAAPLNYDD